jgi:hypothetical protein
MFQVFLVNCPQSCNCSIGQIVVENGFHETLPAADIQGLVVEFFKGQDVTNRHLVFETPTSFPLMTCGSAKDSLAKPGIRRIDLPIARSQELGDDPLHQ